MNHWRHIDLRANRDRTFSVIFQGRWDTKPTPLDVLNDEHPSMPMTPRDSIPDLETAIKSATAYEIYFSQRGKLGSIDYGELREFVESHWPEFIRKDQHWKKNGVPDTQDSQDKASEPPARPGPPPRKKTPPASGQASLFD